MNIFNIKDGKNILKMTVKRYIDTEMDNLMSKNHIYISISCSMPESHKSRGLTIHATRHATQMSYSLGQNKEIT